MGTRKDQIRISCFVIDLWSQFSVDSSQKWLKVLENAFFGVNNFFIGRGEGGGGERDNYAERGNAREG